MPKTKVTPRAKHPNKTKQFLDVTQIALEMFDDEISSFTDEVKEKHTSTILDRTEKHSYKFGT